MAQDTGANNNERLLAAAKADNVELLESVIEGDNYDVNFRDGLGNTALHYAAQYGSTDVLDILLEIEDCDVDLQNRLLKATPLHLAVKLADTDTRHYVVQSLLDAGADTKVKDKHGQRAYDLIPAQDEECRLLIRQSEAAVTQAADVASDSDGDVHSDDVASD